jgi:hypothetical protein
MDAGGIESQKHNIHLRQLRPLHIPSWKLNETQSINEKRENQLSRLYMHVSKLSFIALIVIETALIGVFTHLQVIES